MVKTNTKHKHTLGVGAEVMANRPFHFYVYDRKDYMFIFIKKRQTF